MTINAGIKLQPKYVRLADDVCITLADITQFAKSWEDLAALAPKMAPTKEVAEATLRIVAGLISDEEVPVIEYENHIAAGNNYFYIYPDDSLVMPRGLLHRILIWVATIAQDGEEVLAREYSEDGHGAHIHIVGKGGVTVYDLDKQLTEHRRSVEVHGDLAESPDALTEKLIQQAAETESEVDALREMLRQAISLSQPAQRGVLADNLLSQPAKAENLAGYPAP